MAWLAKQTREVKEKGAAVKRIIRDEDNTQTIASAGIAAGTAAAASGSASAIAAITAGIASASATA
eukprot:scaffold33732_cov79-Isochrysis_galbana.AAC.1